jgi:DNA-binding SARP family transcriptional activator/tetratricopeptide (TPR) repeat protein
MRGAATANAEVESSTQARGRVALLGVPSIRCDDQQWTLPAKAFAIIALLAAEPGHALARNRIRVLLWAEFDQEKANANLRQTLARVRRLEQRIGRKILNDDGQLIALNDAEFDVDLAQALSADVQTLVNAKDWPALEALVNDFTGGILSGIEISDGPFEDWRNEIQTRLRHNALRALAALIAGASGREGVTRRQTYARQLLEIDPTEELGYRVLMETYDAQSERSLALQAYQRCRKVLRDELGVEPDIATRRLAASLGLAEAVTSLPRDGASDSQRRPTAAELQTEAGSQFPAVVLLPPTTVVDDPMVSRVATALVEDVIAGLSRCRSFTVIAAHTSFRIAQAPEGWAAARNVRYSVNTSVKPMSSGLVVAFRLSSTTTGAVLWAIELPFEIENLPGLFGRLSHQLIFSLADAIERAELNLPLAAEDATAYRLYLEGRAAMSNSDLPNLRRARAWYRKSIEQYGSFAPAIAGLSRTLSMEWLVRGLTEDELLRQALSVAENAVETDPFDGRGLRERGFSSLYLKRHDEALASFEQAIALSPGDADLFADYADALAHSGQPEVALKNCLKALSLNPLAPDYYNWILGSIYYQTGAYEAAIEALEPVKHHPGTARLLAASSAMAGQERDASYYASVVREIYPEFRLEYLSRIIPDRDERDTRHLIAGLKRAGLE